VSVWPSDNGTVVTSTKLHYAELG